VSSWTGCPQRLHAGNPAFRPGYDWAVVDRLYQRFDWNESPLRCLHVCFLRRSALDTAEAPRANLGELGLYRRSPVGAAERLLRRVVRRPAGDPRLQALRSGGSSWKLQKYRRGDPVTVDAASFLSAGTHVIA
jgi:hypothetical protein